MKTKKAWLAGGSAKSFCAGALRSMYMSTSAALLICLQMNGLVRRHIIHISVQWKAK